MTLQQNEIDLLPSDGIDYRHWILFVAKNHHWVFKRDDCQNQVVSIQKKNGHSNILGRLDSCLDELLSTKAIAKRKMCRSSMTKKERGWLSRWSSLTLRSGRLLLK